MMRNFLLEQLRLAVQALLSYSRVPVTLKAKAWLSLPLAEPTRSALYLPLVGQFAGLMAAGVYGLSGMALPHGVCVLLAMVTALLVTGACHESGLAVTAESLSHPQGAAATSPASLPFTGLGGYHGVLATVVVLMLRFETLSSISPDLVPALLVCSMGWSNFCALMVARWLPWRTSPSTVGSGPPPVILSRQGWWAALSLAALPLVISIIWNDGALGMLTAALVAFIPARLGAAYLRRRFGAYPPGSLGAVQQCSEVAFQLTVLGLLLVSFGDAPSDDDEAITHQMPDFPSLTAH